MPIAVQPPFKHPYRGGIGLKCTDWHEQAFGAGGGGPTAILAASFRAAAGPNHSSPRLVFGNRTEWGHAPRNHALHSPLVGKSVGSVSPAVWRAVAKLGPPFFLKATGHSHSMADSGDLWVAEMRTPRTSATTVVHCRGFQAEITSCDRSRKARLTGTVSE